MCSYSKHATNNHQVVENVTILFSFSRGSWLEMLSHCILEVLDGPSKLQYHPSKVIICYDQKNWITKEEQEEGGKKAHSHGYNKCWQEATKIRFPIIWPLLDTEWIIYSPLQILRRPASHHLLDTAGAVESQGTHTFRQRRRQDF